MVGNWKNVRPSVRKRQNAKTTNMFSFEIIATDPLSRGRVGRLTTPHGIIETPCFMPCGTKGAVKTLTPHELKEIGCEIILANTFHLTLRPGEDVIAKVGGLHEWMSWDYPLLTDSGGFQVFSLSHVNKIRDDGVEFQSPINGDKIFLSPKRAIEIQEKLGADIIMAFDHCPPGEASYAEAKMAMERTHRWAEECFKAKTRKDQVLFPIIQGGVFEDLRRESVACMSAFDAFGVAIGGLAVGETKEDRERILECIAPLLPKNKPHYLMGIGEPQDLKTAVALGFDMFDCVLPTRLARHGAFWNQEGERQNIKKAAFEKSDRPLADNCRCYACQHFSISYLRHLMIEEEILGHRLLTIHNLTFLIDLLSNFRNEIKSRQSRETRSQTLRRESKAEAEAHESIG